MPNLTNFLKEIMRLYNPLQTMFLREAKQDFKIQKVNVKKGTLISAFLTHSSYDSKVFSKC